jgi:exopolysaccharide biosynthesis predicted pyruvyltransferase EpsI
MSCTTYIFEVIRHHQSVIHFPLEGQIMIHLCWPTLSSVITSTMTASGNGSVRVDTRARLTGQGNSLENRGLPLQQNEVETLRQIIADQQEELLRKDLEVRRLEQERRGQEPYSSRERGHLLRDIEGCLPCCESRARRQLHPGSHQRTGSRWVHLFSRIRTKEVVQVIVMVALVSHLWSVPRIWKSRQTPKVHITPSSSYQDRPDAKDDFKSFPSQQEVLRPETSRPPDPIELYSGTKKESGVYKRHQCIEKIRQRHSTALGPFMDSSDNRRVLLVDPAYHRNVGDHMITLGELEFMKRVGYGAETQSQCHYIQAGGVVPHCNDVINKQNPAQVSLPLALWHGGGNWGDLWGDMREPRINSFVHLLEKNFTIISMPQSYHYGDAELEKRDAEKIKSNIAQAMWSRGQDASVLDTKEGRNRSMSRVVFTWREHESYEVALKRYPFVKNLMVPDIAFQLGPYAPMPPKEDDIPPLDIVVFLRDDKESTYMPQRNKQAIDKILSSVDGGDRVSFSIVDWEDRLERFQSSDYFFTDTSIQLLSMGRVVVCDRLHAAILAYLSGLPFVYINQSTGKISKTLRVAFDSWDGCRDGESAMWARADNLTHAFELATGFLDKYELKPRRKRRKRKSGQ